MDFEKLNINMETLKNALGALEKSVELGQQTGRFRNILTKNDLDNVSLTCVLAIRTVDAALRAQLKDE